MLKSLSSDNRTAFDVVNVIAGLGLLQRLDALLVVLRDLDRGAFHDLERGFLDPIDRDGHRSGPLCCNFGGLTGLTGNQ